MVPLETHANLCSESAALTSGEEGKGFQAKAWREIVNLLKGYADVFI